MPKIAIDMNNKVDKNVATAEVLDFFCFNILVYIVYISSFKTFCLKFSFLFLTNTTSSTKMYTCKQFNSTCSSVLYH